MTPLAIVGFVLTGLVGVSLGLLGGGGSVIMLPVLVYVVGVEAHTAVPLSLAVVGATSLASVAVRPANGEIEWRIAFIFGSAALVGTYLGSQLTALVPGPILLLTFGLLLVGVGVRMWRVADPEDAEEGARGRPSLMLAAGAVVGVLTGFLGVGGGFLIVPAMTRVGGLAMSRAVRTSLVVIAMSSITGLAAHLAQGTTVPLWLAVALTLAALVGLAAGLHWGRQVSNAHLRRGFAAFVISVGSMLILVNAPAAWR